MTVTSAPIPADAAPLVAALVVRHRFAAVGAETLDAFVAQPGATVLAFTEDPVRYRETLDLAVIVPELARAFAGRFRVGVLFAHEARACQPRFGFRRWPALVVLRDGAYVGAIDGLREWAQYVAEMEHLLRAPATRAPTIGVRVQDAARVHPEQTT